jgi:hypothetical protein
MINTRSKLFLHFRSHEQSCKTFWMTWKNCILTTWNSISWPFPILYCSLPNFIRCFTNIIANLPNLFLRCFLTYSFGRSTNIILPICQKISYVVLWHHLFGVEDRSAASRAGILSTSNGGRVGGDRRTIGQVVVAKITIIYYRRNFREMSLKSLSLRMQIYRQKKFQGDVAKNRNY